MEPTLALPLCESHYPMPSHTLTGVDHVTQSNFDSCQAFKRDGIRLHEHEIAMNNHHSTLKATYFQVFQPEPGIIDYGTPLNKLDNSHLGLVGSRVHSALSNHMSGHLLLNSVQYNMLLPNVRNVFRHHKTVYIIQSLLPDVNSDSATWEVNLPTVQLLDDARKITSPVPFTAFTRLDIPSNPFLLHYQPYLEHYNRLHATYLFPPLQTWFTQGVNPLLNLTLLTEVCSICRQLAHVKEEHEAMETDEEHTHKVPSPIHPPSIHLIAPQKPNEEKVQYSLLREKTSSCLVDKSMYVYTPPPSLTSSSCSTLVGYDEEQGDVEPDNDADNKPSSTLFQDSDESHYPPPYCNPISYAKAIGRLQGFLLLDDIIFNPAEIHSTSTACFALILFVDGCFDRTGQDCINPCPSAGV